MGEDERELTDIGSTEASSEQGAALEATDGGVPTGTIRTQHLIHIRPHDEEAVVQAIAPALARINLDDSALQLLVVTPDAETALEISARISAVLPVTSPRRAIRMLKAQPSAVIAGSPADLLSLIRESVLKLDAVRAVVIAWADEFAPARQLDALDALLAELPREAARSLVTRTMSDELEGLAERQFWKARRLGGESELPPPALMLQYVAVAASARPMAMRRVLDDLDPPSAAIIARTDASFAEASAALRGMGYPENGSLVRVTRGAIEPNVALALFYNAPAGEGEIETAALASPARAVTFVRARQLGALRRLMSGLLSPLPNTAAVSKARARSERLRDDLRDILRKGFPAREALLLDPLLEEYDGVELAAAALVLLDRERVRHAEATAAPVVPSVMPVATTGDGGWPRLYVSVGERDGARPGDLVGAITGEAKITSDKIGRIEVRDNHSLVELSPEVAGAVAQTLTGVTIKGRQVMARIDPRRGSSDGPSRERRPSTDERPSRGRHEAGGDRPVHRRPESGDRPQRGRPAFGARPSRDRAPGGGERPGRERPATGRERPGRGRSSDAGDRRPHGRPTGDERPPRGRPAGGDRPTRGRAGGSDRTGRGPMSETAGRAPRAMREGGDWSARGERMRNARRPRGGEEPRDTRE